MKVLKIENNKGYYVLNNEDKDIVDINKEDIFSLLNVIYDNETKMDEINEDNIILNDAARIIYKGIYEYLYSFSIQKENIKKEIDEEFKELEELIN